MNNLTIDGELLQTASAGLGPSPGPVSRASIVLSLTPAQVDGMYAAPVLVIPAPGVGFAIIVRHVTFNLVYAGTAFAGGGVFNLQYGATVHGAGLNAEAKQFAATEMNAVANGIDFDGGIAYIGAATASSAYTNLAVYISNATAPFTGGGTVTPSNVVFTIDYDVAPVS